MHARVYVCTYVGVCMYVYTYIVGPSWGHFEAILGPCWELEPPKIVLSLGRRANCAKLACHPLFISMFRLSDPF